jgi:hypothetical protein
MAAQQTSGLSFGYTSACCCGHPGLVASVQFCFGVVNTLYYCFFTRMFFADE